MAYHVVEGTPPDGCDNNGDSSAGAARAEGAAREAESAEGGARPAAEETRGAKCDSACYEAGSMEWHMRRLQHQPPFDASRPLWRVHLVPLPNGRSAALFRGEHGVAQAALAAPAAFRRLPPSLARTPRASASQPLGCSLPNVRTLPLLTPPNRPSPHPTSPAQAQHPPAPWTTEWRGAHVSNSPSSISTSSPFSPSNKQCLPAMSGVHHSLGNGVSQTSPTPSPCPPYQIPCPLNSSRPPFPPYLLPPTLLSPHPTNAQPSNAPWVAECCLCLVLPLPSNPTHAPAFHFPLPPSLPPVAPLFLLPVRSIHHSGDQVLLMSVAPSSLPTHRSSARLSPIPLPAFPRRPRRSIHHSMGDGVSLMSLLLACTRRTDNSALLPTLPTAKRQTGSQPSSAAAAAAVEVEESEELRKQLDDVGEPEKEQLKPGKVHMPSAASAFTLDSMTESPFAPDPVGQAAAEAAVPSERVTADAGGSVGAGGGGAMGKGAGAAGKRGGVGGLVGVGRWMWQVIAVLGNTLWHVSTFMAVLLWRADTATCVKMKSGSGGAQKKGGKGSSVVLQHPEEGRGEVQTGGGDAVGGDGSGDGGGGRFVFGVSGPMSLTDISRVRRAFGATINDVMVTVISGGLDRYLRHHHEQQAERAGEPTPVATSPLPTTVRLSAVCVVNIRPAPGLQISPLFPFLPLSSSPFQEISSMLAGRSKARWGNCLGTFLLPLPVHSPVLTNGLPTRNGSSDSKSSNGTQGVNGIPKSEQAAGEAEGMVQSKEGGAAGEVEQRRLRMVASMCASKRQSLEAHYNYVNARLVLATAGMKSACTLMGRLLDQTTLSFSNMMGPVEEVSLGGHAIERISPTVLGQPHALTLHFQTYNGAAHIVLSAIRENVPDPAFLMRCCEDAFAALQASVH
ncbi:unnamed protein product [Closterium sp. NIES-64]|nr:unnamed protein product [Closterium sp. NIES-64]